MRRRRGAGKRGASASAAALRDAGAAAPRGSRAIASRARLLSRDSRVTPMFRNRAAAGALDRSVLAAARLHFGVDEDPPRRGASVLALRARQTLGGVRIQRGPDAFGGAEGRQRRTRAELTLVLLSSSGAKALMDGGADRQESVVGVFRKTRAGLRRHARAFLSTRASPRRRGRVARQLFLDQQVARHLSCTSLSRRYARRYHGCVAVLLSICFAV